MLLLLSELQKDHLQILLSQPLQVVVDFCKLAIDYLHNGINPQKYTIAAEKLNISKTSVQNIVQAIVYLLAQGCKHYLSEVDFKSSLAIVGFSSDMQEIITKLYGTKKIEISELLCILQQQNPTLQDLTWRFEIQVASSNSLEEVKPMVTMNFVLQTPKSHAFYKGLDYFESQNKQSKNKQFDLQIDNNIDNATTASQCQNIINHVLIQSDLPNLINMINKLEQALKETKSQHVRKVQRALQK